MHSLCQEAVPSPESAAGSLGTELSELFILERTCEAAAERPDRAHGGYEALLWPEAWHFREYQSRARQSRDSLPWKNLFQTATKLKSISAGEGSGVQGWNMQRTGNRRKGLRGFFSRVGLIWLQQPCCREPSPLGHVCGVGGKD